MTSRILVVEDALDVQLIVADLLRGHGHEVVVSSDGNEAVRIAGEQRFDLMILDVMLPGKTGFELCQSVRERRCISISSATLRSTSNTARYRAPDRL
jgi:DNA-binding response OmpR family regulator